MSAARSRLPRSCFGIAAALHLIATFTSLGADEPVVVPLTVAVDRSFRADPTWNQSVGRALARVNARFGAPLGVRFEIARRASWAPSGASLEAFLERLREQVGPRQGGIVVGVTSRRPEPRHVFGATAYVDALSVVSVPLVSQSWDRELAHELGHVFGAIDASEGLMAGAGDGVDPVNARLMRLHRRRRFPPASFPLVGSQLDAAARLYRDAAGDAPAAAYRALVHLERARGAAVSALRAAVRFVAVQPDASSLDLRAQVLADLGRLDESELDLQEALARQPRRAQTLHNLAVLASRAGRRDEAVTLYRRALEVEPDYAPALADLARLLADAGQAAEALACARRALALQPDLAAARVNLAAAHLASGDTRRAQEVARAAVAAQPASYEAHEVLAAALLADGRAPQALDSLEAAFALAGGNAERLARAGIAFEHAGLQTRAGEAFDAALSLDPGQALAMAGRGRQRLRDGDAVGALRDLTSAVAQNPDDAGARTNLAAAYLEVGRLHDAERTARRELDRAPSAASLTTLALIEQRRGNLDRALALLEQAESLQPDDPEVLANLGTLRAESGRRAEALRTYLRLLEVRPDDALCHNDVAVLYFREGQLEAARRYADRAVALGAPVSPDFLRALGWAAADADHSVP